ncbi:MAG: gamma-glutamyl-gamma-aminobutyrate hydrolase family protein [Ginsengibacter sp.]
MKNILIGISDCSKYFNYENWIKDDPNVQIIKLSYKDDNYNDVEKCDGIILTGGEDVNPRLYNQPEYLAYCNPKDIDEKRDEFEWKILQHTEEKQKPVLGICRGLQFVNVFFGGTLIPDIPVLGKFNHSKFQDGNDREHLIEIDTNSELYKITSQENGEINSAHHQSADMPGFGLVANAMSPDGIIEGMERKEPEGKSFLLLVQWHPERMKNLESIFSKNIKQTFLDAVRNAIQ